MPWLVFRVFLLLAVCFPAVCAGPTVIENVIVYREAGRYGGWPANHGAWNWGGEVVVGFESGFFKANASTHAIDREKKEEHLLARSMDAGKTWTIEKPLTLKPPPGTKMAGTPVEDGGKPVEKCPGGIDFTNRNFAMTVRMEDFNRGPSRFYYSYDRGKNWKGPYALPNFGQPAVLARTDYLVEGSRTCILFLAAAKANGREGRPFCVRTEDGGKTWNFVSYIGPEPDDFAIMPSTIRTPQGEFVTAIRRTKWIETYRSHDGGAHWTWLGKVAESGGNPASLVQLKDGRLAITYGYRLAPYGIRAKISADGGLTWGDEFVLRQDGGTWDLGYPRTIVRPDGNLVTVYYFNDSGDGERYIAATIWSAGTPN